MSTSLTLIGTIMRFSTPPKSDGWCRATLRTDAGSGETVVGRIAGASLGSRVRIDGERATTTYGPQITIVSAEILPAPTAPPIDLPLDNVVTGKVSRIKRSIEESGWHAFTLKTATGSARCSGVIPGLVEGQQITAHGGWKETKFGLEFKVAACDVAIPESPTDVLVFLGGNVKGLGIKKQEQIRLKIGDRLPALLAGSSADAIHELIQVPGINHKLATLIVETWHELAGCWPVISALQAAGVHKAMASKIHEACSRFGLDILYALKYDPFLLARHTSGFSFYAANQIWVNIGCPDSATRTRAEQAILHTLIESERAGHSCAPLRTAIAATSDEHGITTLELSAAVNRLEGQHVRVLATTTGQFVFRARALRQEQDIVDRLLLINHTAPSIPLSPSEQWEAAQFGIAKLGIDINSEKRLALATALRNKITLISGPAGSGKTTIQYALVQSAEKAGLRVVLAAPTGMAAQRLAALCEREATTIHRLLGWNPGLNRFERDSDNYIEADLIIIDEFGMLDAELAQALLAAINPTTRLVACGDSNQLESVSHGAVLRDLIQSRSLPHVALTEIFRTGDGSGIVAAASSVLHGQTPEVAHDYTEIDVHPGQLADRAMARVSELIESGAAPGDIQILTPLHDGPGGRIRLNAQAQDLLNPTGRIIHEQNRPRKNGGAPYVEEFRLGDRVQQTHNNYELDIYNGDLGVIEDIADDVLLIRFGGADRLTKYPTKLIREELTLAYAMTIHKSQGSEFQHVILVGPQSDRMWTRNLVYTAITRARESCTVVQQPGVIPGAVRAGRQQRTTMLRNQLVDKMGRLLEAVI